MDKLRQSAYELYQGLWRRLGKAYQYAFPQGRSIFSEDWDVLIVLDACRADLMQEVASEYEFLDNPGTFVSLGSTSSEWLEKNFVREFPHELNDTAYISGNPFTEEKLDGDQFAVLDEVWEYAWDDERGTIPPRPITDRAIRTSRTQSPERLIIHYMQPHFPSIPEPDFGSEMVLDDDTPWNSVWTKLQMGDTELEPVWDAYRENLRFVLNDVSLLLKNLDAETVVITADHGNLIGELGLYGHPANVPLTNLKRVPWYVTSATDEETYLPTTEREDMDRSVGRRLQHLGYRE